MIRKNKLFYKLHKTLRSINGQLDRKLQRDIARDIVILNSVAKVNELPRARRCSEDKAEDELDKLADLSSKLHKHISSMHRNSLERFETKGIAHPLMLQADIENMLYAVGRLDKHKLGEFKKAKGKPAAHQAEAVTKYFFRAYKRINKKNATRSWNNYSNKEKSKIYQPLTEVFNVLNLSNSAKSQANMLFRKLYKKRK